MQYTNLCKTQRFSIPLGRGKSRNLPSGLYIQFHSAIQFILDVGITRTQQQSETANYLQP